MRLYSIMKDFIEKKDYCSIEFFMSKYNCSKRTIQNDISYLIKVSSRNGFQIHVKRGQGYLLEVTNNKLLKDFVNSLKGINLVDMQDRVKNILACIVINDGYISTENIANKLNCSKTVIKGDIDNVNKLAHSYNLNFESKTHYGLRVFGNAKSLSHYLVDEYLNSNSIITNSVDNIVKDFKEIEQNIIKLLNKNNLNINYNELLNVIVYLKIMVFINIKIILEKENYCIENGDNIKNLCNEIINLVEEIFQIKICKESYDELYNVLKKNVRITQKPKIYANNLSKDIDEFLIDIDKKYGTKFYYDNDFKKLLDVHVSFLLDRLKQKISYKNPLADELSITNPLIFNVAIKFCDMLKEKYGVETTVDEIGFIATHFGAHMEKEKQKKLQSYNKIAIVCSSGGGSAYMLKMQIESIFPRSIVESFSFMHEEKIRDFEPDLIFAILPLSFDIDVPIIYIKELLEIKDLYKIRLLLQCDEYDPYILVNEEPWYESFFTKDLFKISNGQSYLQILKEMGLELEAKGYAKKGYCNHVLERESYVSTVYLNGVCIPHPIEIDGNKNVISVRILKNQLVENDKKIKIIFMVCLKKNQIDLYKNITKKLYQLMKYPKYVEKISNVKSFEEMIAMINELGGVDSEL